MIASHAIRREALRLTILIIISLVGPAIAVRLISYWTGQQLRGTTFLLIAIPIVTMLVYDANHRIRIARGDANAQRQFGLTHLMALIGIAAVWLAIARWDWSSTQTTQGLKKQIERRIQKIVGAGRVHLNQSLLIQVQRPTFNDDDLRLLMSERESLKAVNSHFFYLDLSGTQVTDGGLTALNKCHSLEFLILDNTVVSPDGLKVIDVLPELQILGLANTQVPSTYLAALRRRRPKLQIYPDLSESPPETNPPR